MAIIWNGIEHVIRKGGVEVKTLQRADFGGATPDEADAKTAIDAALLANDRTERAHVHIEQSDPLNYKLLIAALDSPRLAAASRMGLGWWEFPPRTERGQ